MRATTSAIAALLAAVATLTACSASYDQRKAYLDDSAAHGVATHALLTGQGVSTDRRRCEEAYEALKLDVPYLEYAPDRRALAAQGERFFIDSCVSGTPSVGPISAAPPSASSTLPTTPTTVAPPSR